MTDPTGASGLKQWIDGMYAVGADAPELEFEGKWQSWHDLQSIAESIHTLLTENGIGAGKRVGVLLRNRPELVPTLLSLLRNGRCVASVNASAPDDKLTEDLRRAAVPAVIATTADWAREGLGEAVAASGAVGIELTGDPAAPARLVDGLSGDPARWT